MVRAQHPVVGIAGGVRITIKVQPRASASSVEGLHGDALKIRLAAPPVDGAANEALRHLLGEILQRPKSAIQVRSGLASRRKVVEVMGISPPEAARRLGLGATPAPD